MNKTEKILLYGSPVQLIGLVLDFAIQNCQEHNVLKANEALDILISALNFNPNKDASKNFFRVLICCKGELEKNNFRIVLEVLTEIKEAWSEA